MKFNNDYLYYSSIFLSIDKKGRYIYNELNKNQANFFNRY